MIDEDALARAGVELRAWEPEALLSDIALPQTSSPSAMVTKVAVAAGVLVMVGAGLVGIGGGTSRQERITVADRTVSTVVMRRVTVNYLCTNAIALSDVVDGALHFENPDLVPLFGATSKITNRFDLIEKDHEIEIAATFRAVSLDNALQRAERKLDEIATDPRYPGLTCVVAGDPKWTP